jgi:AcrR family transcriptional regulator
MARVADPTKVPASPISRRQVLRRERVLAAAAELGDRDDFDHVQMNDIAKKAGVAIGTLYRYFPSKVQMFNILFHEELRKFAVDEWKPMAVEDPLGEVGDQLVRLTRQFASRRRLMVAMIHCAQAGYMTTTIAEAAAQQLPLVERILAALGISEPTDEDRYRAQLLIYSWWSVLVSIVHQKASPESGEEQIRIAARLLLTQCSCWKQPSTNRPGQ